MISYLTQGARWFGQKPFPVTSRSCWEVFLVLKGKCGPTFDRQLKPDLRKSYLWAFPPYVRHGWGGDHEECEVLIFHFLAAPELLQKSIPSRGYFEKELKPADIREFLRISEYMKPHYERESRLSSLVVQRTIIDLSLAILQGGQDRPSAKKQRRSEAIVSNVLDWYVRHIDENPSISDIAKRSNVSVGHLRRIFWKTYQASPQQVFLRMKIQRGIELMAQTDMKLEALAAACGFSTASNFCRAFKHFKGMSPAKWKKGK